MPITVVGAATSYITNGTYTSPLDVPFTLHASTGPGDYVVAFMYYARLATSGSATTLYQTPPPGWSNLSSSGDLGDLGSPALRTAVIGKFIVPGETGATWQFTHVAGGSYTQGGFVTAVTFRGVDQTAPVTDTTFQRTSVPGTSGTTKVVNGGWNGVVGGMHVATMGTRSTTNSARSFTWPTSTKVAEASISAASAYWTTTTATRTITVAGTQPNETITSNAATAFGSGTALCLNAATNIDVSGSDTDDISGTTTETVSVTATVPDQIDTDDVGSTSVETVVGSNVDAGTDTVVSYVELWAQALNAGVDLDDLGSTAVDTASLSAALSDLDSTPLGYDEPWGTSETKFADPDVASLLASEDTWLESFPLTDTAVTYLETVAPFEFSDVDTDDLGAVVESATAGYEANELDTKSLTVTESYSLSVTAPTDQSAPTYTETIPSRTLSLGAVTEGLTVTETWGDIGLDSLDLDVTQITLVETQQKFNDSGFVGSRVIRIEKGAERTFVIEHHDRTFVVENETFMRHVLVTNPLHTYQVEAEDRTIVIREEA